jgi:hypothetical protein
MTTQAANITIVTNGGLIGNTGGIAQISTRIQPNSSFRDTSTPSFTLARNQAIALSSALNLLPADFTYVGGSQTFLPNKVYKGGQITINSGATLTFDAQGDPNAEFIIFSSTAITITTATINLVNGALASNIFWCAVSGLISIATVSGTSGFTGIAIASTAITTTTTSPITGNLYAIGTNITFATPTTINPTSGPVVCYVKGTKILTDNGYVNIEDLKVNDTIITKGKIHDDEYINLDDKTESLPIIWIGNIERSNLTSQNAPICIKANAFGENLPSEDLFVSPAHRILIEGKMVQANSLINGYSIFQYFEKNSVEYYHIELETHSSIVANGLLAESYINHNNRILFD